MKSTGQDTEINSWNAKPNHHRTVIHSKFTRKAARTWGMFQGPVMHISPIDIGLQMQDTKEAL